MGQIDGVSDEEEMKMNLSQLAWACLIIHHIHRASDKESDGFYWLAMAFLAIILDLFTN